MAPFLIDFFEKLFVIFAYIGLGIAIYVAMMDRYLKDMRNQKRKLDKLRRVNDMSLPPGNDQDTDNERRDKDE